MDLTETEDLKVVVLTKNEKEHHEDFPIYHLNLEFYNKNEYNFTFNQNEFNILKREINKVLK